MLEWECCLKASDQGAAEGAPFIASHIIQAAERSFDDFAGSDHGPQGGQQAAGHEAKEKRNEWVL